MVFQNDKLTILYGSQTGNSQDLAERIWHESKCYYFSGSVKSMDEYNALELVGEKCIIFVCSTTGQGEEPDNMKNFWKFLLKKNLPSDSLSDVRFGVLGLGDSSYAKFNFTAKKLHRRMVQLGAQMLIPVGLGDDQHDLGYDAVADSWIKSLFTNLLVLYPLPIDVLPLSKNSKIIPRWNVSSKDANLHKLTYGSIYQASRSPTEFFATVTGNIRTTDSSHFQDVRLIKLQTNGEKYLPGNVLCLRPKNSPTQIQAFQTILEQNNVDIKPETLFQLSEINQEVPVPAPLRYNVTFQQLCDEYFDLSSIPRRRTFHVLAQLSDSALEREKCLEFTTSEGQNDLYTYCLRPKRNIVEILQDFPYATKNINKEMLFELLTPIKPREFSIASSYATNKYEIHLLVAVVKYKTKLVKEREGLCSNYLANLKDGDTISAWVSNGSFRFPKIKDEVVIMVGPGTGVAPFRNYIHERVVEGTATSDNLILFYGCRGRNKDFHCREEFLRFEKENKLRLICAFSRDQEYKIYVQHKILEYRDLVWNALKKGKAYIFVAGNSKYMPQQVRQAFVDACVKSGNLSKEKAYKCIEEMERKLQYQTETWF